MGVFARLSKISRLRKLELFEGIMRPVAQDRVLDVGAQVSSNPRDVQFIDWYPWKERVTAVNLSQDHLDAIRKRYPAVATERADARQLPWPDKHFDIVFSNAVIEHVGGRSDQRQMASEIMRVGKRWFVATPNRWYPFEFHMRMPFVTWLPWHSYRAFSRIVRYDPGRKRYILGSRYPATLCLMSGADLMRCFPNSRIVKQCVTIMAETLVVIGPDL
jgi:hypothetical protein